MSSLKLRNLLCVFLITQLCGCFSARISEPPRTAIEQLLLSTAADNAMRDVDLSWLRGRKIYVEEKYFDGIDKGYAISLIRDYLSRAGALLKKTDDKADVIVEIRNGGLGMNTSESLIGIPALAIPVPLSGALQIPELALYKSQKADSIGKFALFAYFRDTGEHLESQAPVSGYAHFRLYKILGVSWRKTDVPQLKNHANVDQRNDWTNRVPAN